MQKATGDMQFEISGSLTLVENDSRRYRYDAPSILNALENNYMRDPKMPQFACEPNWVYCVCNELGLAGMLIHDRVHRTAQAKRILPAFLKTLDEEFMTPDGRLIPILADRLGWGLLTKTPLSNLSTCYLLNILSPERAARAWALARTALVERMAGNNVFPEPEGVELLDPGNYERNGTMPYVMAMLNAREMGDEKLYELALAGYRSKGVQNHGGSLQFAGSPLVQMFALIARCGSAGAWYRMAHTDLPKEWTTGPYLAQAPYPQVMVAKAVSDGQRLTLVLRPGTDAGVPQCLELTRLQPGRAYIANGLNEQTITADMRGTAQLMVSLTERTEINLATV